MNFGAQMFPERFWEKLIPEPNTGCWLWLAGTTAGRASYWDGNAFVRPQRMAYSALYELPAQRRLVSLCGTENCCNPLHYVDVPPQTKEERAAYKSSWRREGLRARPELRERRNELARDSYAKSPASSRKAARQWQEANPERVRDYNKEWRSRNPDKVERTSRASRLRKYGLTIESFEKLIAEHDSRCAICGCKVSRESGVENALHIDHCHKTGRVRGILCGKCNLGLGLFADDPIRLKAAQHYLEKEADNGPR